jgi:PAS domain S-box-containing protein
LGYVGNQARRRLPPLHLARRQGSPRYRAAADGRRRLALSMQDGFFMQSLDLQCIAGFDGHFKRVNPAWTTDLGWSREVLQATPFLDFVHPDDRESTQAEVAKLVGGGDTVCFENRYRHQNGSYHWLQWNARPVPGRHLIYATARNVDRQKQLERQILEVADREKERLGRELHDGLCQTLAGIAALSATLSRSLVASSDFDGSAAAARIARLLSKAIGEARDLSRGLSPSGLRGGNLAVALEGLALNVLQLFRVSCTFESEGPVPRLAQEVAAHLFRIAQEAVSNAVAHGRADRIEISLGGTDGDGLLSVRDNGVGLPDEAHQGRGIGLHTMAYRARLIRGSLDVRRLVPRGTAVTCVFPLPEAPGHTLDHARENG